MTTICRVLTFVIRRVRHLPLSLLVAPDKKPSHRLQPPQIYTVEIIGKPIASVSNKCCVCSGRDEQAEH